jgi:hypothetical protein
MAEAWDWRQSYLEYSRPLEAQGLELPAPQGPEVPAQGQQMHADPHGAPHGYVQPPGSVPYAGPYPEYAAYAPPVASQGARAFSIAAFICGGLALLLLPFILGPLGITFGFVGQSRGDRLGKWAGLMSIATTLLGIAFHIWMASNVGGGFAD